MGDPLPDEVEAELRMEATSRAEAALAKAPAGPDRAAQIAKVSEGIFKQLTKKYWLERNGGTSKVVPASADKIAAAPPPPPPDSVVGTYQVPKSLDGVGMCGDELWFSDLVIRRRLQQRDVALVHAKQKVLMGTPAEEIKRICPDGAFQLGAGAVLRLGGNLGFYGEEDISYCYRQTSRAVHPDKNRGIPEAAIAFKRLQEAADELRQGLAATRDQLHQVTQRLGGFVGEEDLKRPQEALLAEMSKVLHDVLMLSGEGRTTDSDLKHAAEKFASSSSSRRDAESFLALFYDSPALVDCLASRTLRVAFDCAPKHIRAQFVCALNRVALVEERRKGDTRSTWVEIEANFPEIEWWRELRFVIGKRAVAAGIKASKWDDTDADFRPEPTEWSRPYQDKLSDFFVSEFWAAEGREVVDCMHPTLRTLSADLWRDIVDWASPNVAPRNLQLFAADGSEALTVAPDNQDKDKPSEVGQAWSFVPAADLLLLIAPGLVGITGDGITWAKSFSRELEVKDIDAFNRMDDARKKEQLERQSNEGFDWERAWRDKKDKQRSLRDLQNSRGPRDRSRSYRRRNRSRSRSRSRGRRRSDSRGRRRRSRSRRR